MKQLPADILKPISNLKLKKTLKKTQVVCRLSFFMIEIILPNSQQPLLIPRTIADRIFE